MNKYIYISGMWYIHKVALPALLLMLSACQLIETRPQNVSGWFIQAENAYRLQDYDKARHYYQQVLSVETKHVESLFKLANIDVHQSQWQSAVIAYQRVLHIAPTHRRAHHNLAILHLSMAATHLHAGILNYQHRQKDNVDRLIKAIHEFSGQADMQSPAD